jgi:hypothetical protein
VIVDGIESDAGEDAKIYCAEFGSMESATRQVR